MKQINWNNDLGAALGEAKKSGKLVLAFFNIPACWECAALREDGFSNETVQQFMSENYIPLMFLTKQNPEAASKMNINWSPSLIVLDEDGTEHYRSYGAQNSADLLATLMVARGRADFNRQRYDTAIKYFDEVINNLSSSTSIAEAYYWKGACYDKKGDMETTKKLFNILADKFSQSHWGRAASAIRRTQ